MRAPEFALDIHTEIHIDSVVSEVGVAEHSSYFFLVVDDGIFDIDGFTGSFVVEEVSTHIGIVLLIDDVEAAQIEGHLSAVEQEIATSVYEGNLTFCRGLVRIVAYNIGRLLHIAQEAVAAFVDKVLHRVRVGANSLSCLIVFRCLRGIENHSLIEHIVSLDNLRVNIFIRLVHSIAHRDESVENLDRYVQCQQGGVHEVHHCNHFLPRGLRAICSTHILSFYLFYHTVELHYAS